MNNVYFDFKGAYRDHGDHIELFLSRQGVTATRNCAHPLFFAEIAFDYKGLYFAKVHFSNNDNYPIAKRGQVYKEEPFMLTEVAAIKHVERHASKLAGKPVKINPQTLHYCHGWQQYDYEKTDLFLSPVFYSESSDTVRHYPSNYCLVAFTDGKFSQPDLDVDKAATKYRPQIEKALKSGFHDCDLKRGEDYCKRRLAWLVGEYIKADHAEGKAEWCNLDMTIRKEGQNEI